MGNYKFGMADMEAGRWQQVKQLFAAAEKFRSRNARRFSARPVLMIPSLRTVSRGLAGVAR